MREVVVVGAVYLSVFGSSMLVSLSYYVNHGNVLDFPASLHEVNRRKNEIRTQGKAGSLAGRRVGKKTATQEETGKHQRGLCVLIMNFQALHKSHRCVNAIEREGLCPYVQNFVMHLIFGCCFVYAKEKYIPDNGTFSIRRLHPSEDDGTNAETEIGAT